MINKVEQMCTDTNVTGKRNNTKELFHNVKKLWANEMVNLQFHLQSYYKNGHSILKDSLYQRYWQLWRNTTSRT